MSSRQAWSGGGRPRQVRWPGSSACNQCSVCACASWSRSHRCPCAVSCRPFRGQPSRHARAFATSRHDDLPILFHRPAIVLPPERPDSAAAHCAVFSEPLPDRTPFDIIRRGDLSSDCRASQLHAGIAPAPIGTARSRDSRTSQVLGGVGCASTSSATASATKRSYRAGTGTCDSQRCSGRLARAQPRAACSGPHRSGLDGRPDRTRPLDSSEVVGHVGAWTFRSAATSSVVSWPSSWTLPRHGGPLSILKDRGDDPSGRHHRIGKLDKVALEHTDLSWLSRPRSTVSETSPTGGVIDPLTHHREDPTPPRSQANRECGLVACLEYTQVPSTGPRGRRIGRQAPAASGSYETRYARRLGV
jgi:hypothetical protein